MQSAKIQEEFIELQKALMEANKIKFQTLGKIQLNERAKRRDELTLKELDQVPANTRTFAAVGKMFLLKPKGDVSEDIKQRLGRIDKELDTLYKQQKYTEQKVQEHESAVKELMIQNAIAQGITPRN